MESILSDSTQQSPESLEKSSADQTDTNMRKGREPKKITFSEEQVRKLEAQYVKDKYPSKDTRYELANDFSIPENKIKVWFQNRRIKEKRDRIMLNSMAIRRQLYGRDGSIYGGKQPPTCVTIAVKPPGDQRQLTPPRMYTAPSGCFGHCTAPVCIPDYPRRSSLSPPSPYTYGVSSLSSSSTCSPMNASVCVPSYPDKLFGSGFLPSPYLCRISPPFTGSVVHSPLPFSFLPPPHLTVARTQPPIPFYL